MNSNKKVLKTMTGIAVFSALAFIVSFAIRVPVQFLTFDAKDAIIAIASFVYGPISAVAMALIAALIEVLTISDTGIYGFIMNFASSAIFALVASAIYKYKKSFAGSVIGLYCAVLATVGVMMLLNVFVTPFYMGVPRAVVVDLIPTLLLPFNAAKSLMNASIALMLYKPVTYSLRRARLISGSDSPSISFNKRSALSLIIGGATLVCAVVIFVILKMLESA